MRLVGEPIDERFAKPRIGDHLRPLGERQVGGDDDRGFLCPVGDHLEHQFARGLGQRHITEFVDTDQVEPGDVQDLTSLIDTFIPEGGVCCGPSDMSVQIDNAGTSTVTVADDFYGLFVGSVNSSDTGSVGTLNWVSAVYGSPLSIDLTNADNVITDALFNVGPSLANTSAPTTRRRNPPVSRCCAPLCSVWVSLARSGAHRRRGDWRRGSAERGHLARQRLCRCAASLRSRGILGPAASRWNSNPCSQLRAACARSSAEGVA